MSEMGWMWTVGNYEKTDSMKTQDEMEERWCHEERQMAKRIDCE